jgi:hypothetical protein
MKKWLRKWGEGFLMGGVMAGMSYLVKLAFHDDRIDWIDMVWVAAVAFVAGRERRKP